MGYRREYIALHFRNQADLFTVRRELLPIATKNRETLDAVDTYAEVIAGETNYAAMDYDMEDGFGHSEGFVKGGGAGQQAPSNPPDSILDIREYDVPYYLRVAIDKSGSRSLRRSLLFLRGSLADLARRRASRAVVRGDGRYGRGLAATPRGASRACRARRHGVRHRDDQGTAQVPRPAHRPGHDDLVHD